MSSSSRGFCSALLYLSASTGSSFSIIVAFGLYMYPPRSFSLELELEDYNLQNLLRSTYLSLVLAIASPDFSIRYFIISPAVDFIIIPPRIVDAFFRF